MLRQQFQKPFVRDLAFFVVLVFGMITVGWDAMLMREQGEPHLWRQSDCISIAQYYAKGTPFFEPEMHCRFSDDGTTGKTVAEFPIVYYIIGKIWSVTGTQLWIFRLFNALFCVVALTLLYRLVYKLSGSWFWSVLAPILLLSSPVYAFYGINFLTNVPAFNCVIVAWYFFYRYYEDQRTKHLLWMSFFFVLAGLLKVSALTSYVMLLCVFAVDLTGVVRFRATGKIFRRPLVTGLILLAPISISLLWYLGFVEQYCFIHGGRYSFTEPMPAWNMDPEMRKHTWDIFLRFTAHQVYPPHVWLFFVAAFLFLFVKFRKVNPFWLVAMPLVLLGHTIFALLFFFSLDGHDYYHIDLLFFFLLVYVAFVKYFSTHENAVSRSLVVRLIAALMLFYALLGSASNLHLRAFGCNSNGRAWCETFNNRSTIEMFQYFHDLEWYRQPYKRIGEELTRRGFSKEVPVIAINDVSFNSLLLLVDRPGFTNLGDAFADSSHTAYRIERGAQILLVEHPEHETRSITAFMDYLLFKDGHVGVYDLRPYASPLKKE